MFGVFSRYLKLLDSSLSSACILNRNINTKTSGSSSEIERLPGRTRLVHSLLKFANFMEWFYCWSWGHVENRVGDSQGPLLLMINGVSTHLWKLMWCRSVFAFFLGREELARNFRMEIGMTFEREAGPGRNKKILSIVTWINHERVISHAVVAVGLPRIHHAEFVEKELWRFVDNFAHIIIICQTSDFFPNVGIVVLPVRRLGKEPKFLLIIFLGRKRVPDDAIKGRRVAVEFVQFVKHSDRVTNFS